MVVVGVDAMAMDGGFGSERERPATAPPATAQGLAEQSVLAALLASSLPLAPAEIIRELESAGFRNPDIRSAIWHLLDRHRIRLTRDLRLVLPVVPTTPATS
ncbi:MAG: hypothetical protein WBA46_10940 [Thermomicrobiales bacterium]